MKLNTVLCLTLAFRCTDIEGDVVNQYYCKLWDNIKEQKQICQSSVNGQSSISRTLAKQTNAMEDLNKQVTTLQNNTILTDFVNTKFENQTNGMDLMKKQLGNQLDSQTNLLETLIQQLNQSQGSKLNDLEKISETQAAEIKSLQSDIYNLNKSVTEVTKAKQILEKLNETKSTEIQNLQNEVKNFNKSVSELTDSKANLEEVNEQLKAEIEDLRNDTTNLNKSLAELTDSKANLEVVNERLQAEIKNLNNDTKNLNKSLTECAKSEVEVCAHPSGSGRWISGGHRINDTFSNVLSKVTQVNNKVDMYTFNTFTWRMLVVQDQLWVSVYGNSTILIVDINTVRTIKQIKHTNIQSPLSIGSDYYGQVLVCSENGLHVLSHNGTYLYKVPGYITDIHIECDFAYVYNKSNNNVVTLKYKNNIWIIHDTFLASKSTESQHNTILIIKSTIYLCSRFSNIIHTYTTTGVYVRQYGSSGSKTGQLDRPRLLGIDSRGSILVAEHGNDRFQVLSSDGTWQVFTLQGIRYPFDIVLDSQGTLWVLYYNGHWKISKFLV